jgi:hypothetical protein
LGDRDRVASALVVMHQVSRPDSRNTVQIRYYSSNSRRTTNCSPITSKIAVAFLTNFSAEAVAVLAPD